VTAIDWGKAPIPRPRRCARCGTEDKSFNVSLRAFQTVGVGRSAKSLASRSKSFCEPCAFAVYSELVEHLEAVSDRLPVYEQSEPPWVPA
jgi:hypothetical protein